MANSADSDQLASSEATDLDLHCLQRQGISGFSRTRVKYWDILIPYHILLPADVSMTCWLSGKQYAP